MYWVEEYSDLFRQAAQEKVAENLEKDEHRWYETSTTVYKVGDWFLGVNGVTRIYSERMDADDIGLSVTAFEMEEVPSVTYRRKKQ